MSKCVCMHTFMDVYVRMHIRTYVCVYICMNACKCVCMHACMHVCTYGKETIRLIPPLHIHVLFHKKKEKSSQATIRAVTIRVPHVSHTCHRNLINKQTMNARKTKICTKIT